MGMIKDKRPGSPESIFDKEPIACCAQCGNAIFRGTHFYYNGWILGEGVFEIASAIGRMGSVRTEKTETKERPLPDQVFCSESCYKQYDAEHHGEFKRKDSKSSGIATGVLSAIGLVMLLTTLLPQNVPFLIPLIIAIVLAVVLVMLLYSRIGAFRWLVVALILVLGFNVSRPKPAKTESAAATAKTAVEASADTGKSTK